MWLADERAQHDAAACGRRDHALLGQEPVSLRMPPAPLFPLPCIRHPCKIDYERALLERAPCGQTLRRQAAVGTFHFAFKQVGLPICFKTTPLRDGQLFAQPPALVCARTHCPLHSYLQHSPCRPQWPASPFTRGDQVRAGDDQGTACAVGPSRAVPAPGSVGPLAAARLPAPGTSPCVDRAQVSPEELFGCLTAHISLWPLRL